MNTNITPDKQGGCGRLLAMYVLDGRKGQQLQLDLGREWPGGGLSTAVPGGADDNKALRLPVSRRQDSGKSVPEGSAQNRQLPGPPGPPGTEAGPRPPLFTLPEEPDRSCTKPFKPLLNIENNKSEGDWVFKTQPANVKKTVTFKNI